MDESTTAGRQASRSMLERRNVRRVAFNVEWSHWCRVLHASARQMTLESGLCDWFERRHALHLTHVRRRRIGVARRIDLVVTTKSFHLMQTICVIMHFNRSTAPARTGGETVGRHCTARLNVSTLSEICARSHHSRQQRVLAHRRQRWRTRRRHHRALAATSMVDTAPRASSSRHCQTSARDPAIPPQRALVHHRQP
jgi:hypothetical protein